MPRGDLSKVDSFSIEAMELINRACAVYRLRLTEYAMQQAVNVNERKKTVQVEQLHVEWALSDTGGYRGPRIVGGKLSN